MTRLLDEAIKSRADDLKRHKAMLWHRIKENDAQMAEFLKTSHEIFGEPKYLKVTLHTGEVIGEIYNDKLLELI